MNLTMVSAFTSASTENSLSEILTSLITSLSFSILTVSILTNDTVSRTVIGGVITVSVTVTILVLRRLGSFFRAFLRCQSAEHPVSKRVKKNIDRAGDFHLIIRILCKYRLFLSTNFILPTTTNKIVGHKSCF